MSFLRCGVPFLFLLAACGGGGARQEAPSAAPPPDAPPPARTLVYDCDGYEIVARTGPGEIGLWFEDEHFVLPEVRSASGALYEEGDVSFWSKGDRAMITAHGQTFQDCQLMHARGPWEDARRRGVDFRATGNEPGWHLEIQRGRQILFIGDYGATRVLLPDPGEERAGNTRLYHGAVGARTVRIEIVDEPCADTMADASFPSRVTVTLDDTVLHGCGQDLDQPWEDAG